MNQSTSSQYERQAIIRMMVSLDDAGLLSEAMDEALFYCRNEAEDRTHCAPGKVLYADSLAQRASNFLDGSIESWREAAEAVVLRTRLQITREAFSRFLGQVHSVNGRHVEQESEWDPIADFERYGLDAMLALPPLRADEVDSPPPPSPPRPHVRIVRGDK